MDKLIILISGAFVGAVILVTALGLYCGTHSVLMAFAGGSLLNAVIFLMAEEL